MTIKFTATGTQWLIECDLAESKSTQIKTDIEALTRDFESVFSRFDESSLVSKLHSQTGGAFEFPHYAHRMFDHYQDLEDASDGAFTPLIGSSLKEAGYDRQYSLKAGAISDVPRLRKTLEFDQTTIKTSSSVELDFGAMGKGLLIDLTAELLRDAGSFEFMINAGGDIYTTDKKRVGLEHPVLPDTLVGVLSLGSGALCGSSGNRRNWGKFHHIIDATSKQSPQDVLASWVVAKDALTADALATALFLIESHKLSSYEFEYLLISGNGSFKASKGFDWKPLS